MTTWTEDIPSYRFLPPKSITDAARISSERIPYVSRQRRRAFPLATPFQEDSEESYDYEGYPLQKYMVTANGGKRQQISRSNRKISELDMEAIQRFKNIISTGDVLLG